MAPSSIIESLPVEIIEAITERLLPSYDPTTPVSREDRRKAWGKSREDVLSLTLTSPLIGRASRRFLLRHIGVCSGKQLAHLLALFVARCEYGKAVRSLEILVEPLSSEVDVKEFQSFWAKFRKNNADDMKFIQEQFEKRFISQYWAGTSFFSVPKRSADDKSHKRTNFNLASRTMSYAIIMLPSLTPNLEAIRKDLSFGPAPSMLGENPLQAGFSPFTLDIGKHARKYALQFSPVKNLRELTLMFDQERIPKMSHYKGSDLYLEDLLSAQPNIESLTVYGYQHSKWFSSQHGINIRDLRLYRCAMVEKDLTKMCSSMTSLATLKVHFVEEGWKSWGKTRLEARQNTMNTGLLDLPKTLRTLELLYNVNHDSPFIFLSNLSKLPALENLTIAPRAILELPGDFGGLTEQRECIIPPSLRRLTLVGIWSTGKDFRRDSFAKDFNTISHALTLQLKDGMLNLDDIALATPRMKTAESRKYVNSVRSGSKAILAQLKALGVRVTIGKDLGLPYDLDEAMFCLR